MAECIIGWATVPPPPPLALYRKVEPLKPHLTPSTVPTYLLFSHLFFRRHSHPPGKGLVGVGGGEMG